MRHISFRVDANVNIGVGHFMRCLTVAEEMRDFGFEITFFCRELSGGLDTLISDKAMKLFMLPSSYNINSETDFMIRVIQETDMGIDWLVIDHYGIGHEWENKIRLYVRNLAVIDDLANRPHNCDLLLDQNWVENFEHRYEGLVPKSCKLLLGPSHAILRNEFYDAHSRLLPRTGEIRNILVFFGGSDPTHETRKTIQALQANRYPEIIFHVVVGSSNTDAGWIKQFCLENICFQFHFQIDYMAELMLLCDMAIGAGGSTVWERCFLGLPSIVIAVAENQLPSSEMVGAHGIAWYLGWHLDVTAERIAGAVSAALRLSNELKRMSDEALLLMGNLQDSNISSTFVRTLRGDVIKNEC
jgi:UDP-2,4-diacetamido-2,4,6-trideoxy-beta-L-altropyranose hydrolase